MRLQPALDQIGQYFDILQPAHVAEYLATQSWSCLADRPFGQLWSLPGRPTGSISSVVLPKNSEAPDYGVRISEAVAALVQVLDLSVSELAEAVASVHADLFFVRVDQSMADGTIPLRQASQLLEGIDQMIKSAALAAFSPHHSGQGKVPGVVSEFLSEDVRMGHTKRGSFVITVAARHDLSVPQLPIPATSSSAPDLSFSRNVMTTLSRALDATRRHVAKDSDYVDLEKVVASGVRLPLVDALQEMGAAPGLRSVGMSFEWSTARPKPDSIPSEVSFSRAELENLGPVSLALRRKFEPRVETVSGPVVELRRDETQWQNDDAGEVVVRAEVGGLKRNIHVDLSGNDYEAAIRAHQSGHGLVVTGAIEKRGRYWIMSEPILGEREAGGS